MGEKLKLNFFFLDDVTYKIFPLYKKNFYWETKLTCWWSFSASPFLLLSETCPVSNTLVPSMFTGPNIWWAKIVGTTPSTNSFFLGCLLKCSYIRFLFIQSLWKWFSHKTEFLLNLNVFMSCPILILCSHCYAHFRCVAFLGSGILKKLLRFVVFPVVFLHLHAWQVGIPINVNVNCEIMKCNKHQQQTANKLIICITQTKN